MGRAARTCIWGALVAVSFAAGAAEPDATPVGAWRTIDDETGQAKSIVRIFQEGSKLKGQIEELFRGPNEDPEPLCDKCDGDLRGKPIRGMTILWDLEKDGAEWSGGRVLDPNNGKVYRCTIEVDGGGKRLKVRGYVGFSLLGRTQYWLREPARAKALP